MKATLEVINQMQADGIIGKYAIGGAVGATFYLEPTATVGLDVFVTLPGTPAGLTSLKGIYNYLKKRNVKVEDEYFVLHGWHVQFLPPANCLEQEAIAESVGTSVKKVKTWVMAAEHLVAIALQTGRSKDYLRILQLMEQGAADRARLNSVLKHHGLEENWKQFSRGIWRDLYEQAEVAGSTGHSQFFREGQDSREAPRSR